jgi:GxxExxY protein
MADRLPLLYEAETRSVIGAFFECYNHIGFGFVESICCSALERELISRGHNVAREVAIEVFYKGESVGWQRMDMVVDDKIIVEVKATPILSPNARLQLRSYMKSTRLRVGLLLHFGPRPLFFREYSDANKFKLTDRPDRIDRPNPKTLSVEA